MNWEHSDGNNVIINIKKSPALRGTRQWYYKEQTISSVASILRRTMPTLGDIDKITFVPIPPSKTKNHHLHDDRMSQVLSKIRLPNFDYRELLYTTENRDALHESTRRRDIDEIAGSMAIDERLINGVRQKIVLVDDMITTGASFCAARRVLQEQFADAEYAGLFLARRQLRSAFDDFIDDFP
jgi:predicted amidophosphoribosyltransferase